MAHLFGLVSDPFNTLQDPLVAGADNPTTKVIS